MPSSSLPHCSPRSLTKLAPWGVLTRLVAGLLCAALCSCALQSEEDAAVAINEEALPRFENKPQDLNEQGNSSTEQSSTPAPSTSQQGGLAFRTPDLTKTLPSASDLAPLKKVQREIDDSIEENTTIRAGE